MNGVARSRHVGVVGAGGEGLALTAYLASIGCEVSVCTRHPQRIAGVSGKGALRATGRLHGEFAVETVTDDLRELMARCDLVFVATVTTAYQELAARLAPLLTPGHTVALFSSKLCGSAEFATAVARAGGPAVDVLETDALFAARPAGAESVQVHGIKQWNLFAGLSGTVAARHEGLMRDLFPSVDRATNLIERGLVDFGAVAHAPIALANLSRIDRGDHLLFYREGLSERTVVLLDQVGREFQRLGDAYGAEVPPLPDLLDRYYGCRPTDSVLNAMRDVHAYKDIAAPDSLDHRFLHEDVSSTLVPMIELADRADVEIPMTEAVVTFASVLAGRDYRRTGRTLDRLGWAELSRDGIMATISE